MVWRQKGGGEGVRHGQGAGEPCSVCAPVWNASCRSVGPGPVKPSGISQRGPNSTAPEPSPERCSKGNEGNRTCTSCERNVRAGWHLCHIWGILKRGKGHPPVYQWPERSCGTLWPPRPVDTYLGLTTLILPSLVPGPPQVKNQSENKNLGARGNCTHWQVHSHP